MSGGTRRPPHTTGRFTRRCRRSSTIAHHATPRPTSATAAPAQRDPGCPCSAARDAPATLQAAEGTRHRPPDLPARSPPALHPRHTPVTLALPKPLKPLCAERVRNIESTPAARRDYLSHCHNIRYRPRARARLDARDALTARAAPRYNHVAISSFPARCLTFNV